MHHSRLGSSSGSILQQFVLFIKSRLSLVRNTRYSRSQLVIVLITDCHFAIPIKKMLQYLFSKSCLFLLYLIDVNQICNAIIYHHECHFCQGFLFLRL